MRLRLTNDDDDAPTAVTSATATPGDARRRFEVRSVTGACYTIVEEVGRDGERRYRTAYARLPVVANDDGTFTIVDTGTRLVRIDAHR